MTYCAVAEYSTRTLGVYTAPVSAVGCVDQPVSACAAKLAPMVQRIGFRAAHDAAAWIASPVPFEERFAGGQPNYPVLESVAWEHTLRGGVRLVAQRVPIFIFEFPGVPFANRPSGEPMDQQIEEKRAYLLMMNAFSYCLHVAGMKAGRASLGSFAINQTDLIHYNETSISMDSSGPSRGLPFALLGSTDFITKEILDDAAALLSAMEDSGGASMRELAGLMNRALAAFRDYDYPSALITAWFVTELALGSLWEGYIARAVRGESEPASLRRLKPLRDSRNFTASVRTEVLTMAGEIDEATRETLNKARNARNGWVHRIKSPDRETADMALHLAHGLFARTSGLELAQIAPSAHVWG